MNRNYLIDIGASFTRFGVSSDTMKEPIIVKKTPPNKEQILFMLENGFNQLRSEIVVCNNSLVVSCAGMINEKGEIKESYYLDLKGVSLYSFFKRVFKDSDRIIVENDANAQALGQYNGKHLLYIVVGSAVGGAYIDENGILKGQHGFACELGHLPVIDSHKKHVTNNVLDDIVSGLSIDRKLGPSWWEHLDDKNTLNYIKYAGESLANVIKNLILILDPGEICICGHLCNIAEFKKAIRNYLYDVQLNNSFIMFKTNTWELVNKACFKLL